jgi:hypothetical protein
MKTISKLDERQKTKIDSKFFKNVFFQLSL